ncbi:COMM domain-containing protein 7-like [Clytia hemisphaerica]|uniref:COMM domain-containing protein n=1 Tax=Clytia hemisphaerica TaxID=252671 RepID=A0A7M5WJK1_9CNID|eukprot:TCONS_00058493-protein
MTEVSTSSISSAEVQILNRFPEESFNEFIQLVFDFLLNPKDASKLLDDLHIFCENAGASAGAVKNLVKLLISYLREKLKKNVSSNSINDQLEKLGLSASKLEIILEKWKQYNNVLTRSMANQVFNINQLVDMDWKFGVTAATSDEGQVGHSFIQLKLVIDKGNKENENVCLELTLPQFYEFLHEMQKAKNSLELLG